MGKMMAYCGLFCDDCSAYKATVLNDFALREETAKEWSRLFSKDIKPEDINCLGCNSIVLYTYCRDCEIRSCAREKAIDHCGKCETFACGKVERILKHDDAARERLQKGRS